MNFWTTYWSSHRKSSSLYKMVLINEMPCSTNGEREREREREDSSLMKIIRERGGISYEAHLRFVRSVRLPKPDLIWLRRERERKCFDIPGKGEAVYLAWQIGFGWGCQSTHGVLEVHLGQKAETAKDNKCINILYVRSFYVACIL